MKNNSMMWALCLLLIGVAIGYYLAVKLRPKTIAMKFNPVGEMLVEAKTGDHLKWFDPTGAAVGVKFKYGLSACTDGGDGANGTCTMKNSAVYKFECKSKGCPDPGLGGGDETLTTEGGSGHLDPPYATPGTVNVYCDPGSNTAKADPALIQAKQGEGDGFTLQVVGASDFAATFPSGTCDGGDTLSYGSPNCRIKTTVAASTYNYTLSVTACMTPGTGQLQVNP